MATKAKDYAKEQLGQLDLTHLDKERNVAKDIYDTSTQGLNTNYGNLIEQINKNRSDLRSNFNKGRGTIAENAFTQNRLNKLDVGSRVAGVSGLKQLGEVGNRMETGRQYSDLANTFYSDKENLDMTERHGTDQYNLDKRSLGNIYNQSIAGIDSRGAEAGNAWNQTLAQLAESVQGRWDSNANAQAALKQAKEAAAQANTNAKEAMAQQLKTQKRGDLESILQLYGKDKPKLNGKDQGKYGSSDLLSALQTQFGVDRNLATNVLIQHGLWDKNYTPIGYDNKTNYGSSIYGGY